MANLNLFEKRLCQEVTDRTGRRVTGKNLLAWSVSRPWIEKMKDENEDVVFVPDFEVFCLVRN